MLSTEQQLLGLRQVIMQPQVTEVGNNFQTVQDVETVIKAIRESWGPVRGPLGNSITFIGRFMLDIETDEVGGMVGMVVARGPSEIMLLRTDFHDDTEELNIHLSDDFDKAVTNMHSVIVNKGQLGEFNPDHQDREALKAWVVDLILNSVVMGFSTEALFSYVEATTITGPLVTAPEETVELFYGQVKRFYNFLLTIESAIAVLAKNA